MTTTLETTAAPFPAPQIVDWRRCVDCGEVFRSARPWCWECLPNYGADWPWLAPQWQASPDELRRRLLDADGLTAGERAGTWLLTAAVGGHWMAAPVLRSFVGTHTGGWLVDFDDIAEVDLGPGDDGKRLRRRFLDEPIEARWILSAAYALALPNRDGVWPVERTAALITGPDRALVDLAIAHAAGRASLDRRAVA